METRIFEDFSGSLLKQNWLLLSRQDPWFRWFLLFLAHSIGDHSCLLVKLVFSPIKLQLKILPSYVLFRLKWPIKGA